ncbi:MAG: hypothetical protein JJU45_10915 [Acidimicrobiia bacterium]|nr:hypothetical protein [Acidimicrobiia bacterium]
MVTGDEEEDSQTSFPALAQSAFGFLIDLGFTIVSLDHGSASPVQRVRYESPAGVFVELIHVPREAHTGMRVGSIGAPRDAINEVELRLASGSPELPRGSTQADELNLMAALLQLHGDQALRADPGLFHRVAELRRVYTERFTARRDE